jgi:hypothetical protein
LAARPVVPAPPPADRRDIRRRLRQEATAPVPWWNLVAWWHARAGADAGVDAAVAARQAVIDAGHADQQRDADRWWQQLCDNDPDVVTDRLERDFADNVVPAAVAEVAGATAHLLLTADRPERLIGDREPRFTDKGNLSLAKMTQTRRNQLYGEAVAASILAVACEAFALAPSLTHVEVAVLQPDGDDGPAVIGLADLVRDEVLETDEATARVRRPVDAALGDATIVTRAGGRTGRLQPLPREEDEAVAMLLDTIDER